MLSFYFKWNLVMIPHGSSGWSSASSRSALLGQKLTKVFTNSVPSLDPRPVMVCMARKRRRRSWRALLLHEGYFPSKFHHQHQPLLSGCMRNPSLPKGLIYQGVSEDPVQLSGGSWDLEQPVACDVWAGFIRLALPFGRILIDSGKSGWCARSFLNVYLKATEMLFCANSWEQR